MATFSVAVLAASLAFFSNFILRVWQYRREHWIARANEFSSLVEDVAAEASEYWCETSSVEGREGLPKREAKIIGLLMQLDGLFVAMDVFWESGERENLKNRLTALQVAVAEGEFQSQAPISLQAGAERARLIHSRAADLLLDVRGAVDEAVRFTVWNRAWRRPIRVQGQ